jgi:UDP-GlcNAc:undecaprenyl-phosphate GlcNAc-1-phosphate transferase
MGDSGSMLIGIVLAASTVTLSGQFSGADITTDGSSIFVYVLPVLLPVSLLMVPVADLVLAVVRRTRAGRSPFAPDKQHLHHRLLEIGHSQRRAVLIMWLWAGLVSSSAVLTSLYSGPWMWTGLGVLFFVTVALTFLVPVLKKPGQLEVDAAGSEPQGTL